MSTAGTLHFEIEAHLM